MPTLSHTAMECWSQCQRRYCLERIERVPQAPSPALMLGQACHSAIEADTRRRSRGVRHGGDQTRLMALADFTRALRDELAQRDPRGLITAGERATLVRRGHAIVTAYAYGAAPRLYPMAGAVEESFKVDVPGAPGWQFTGRMDARTRVGERAPVICDMKTGKRWAIGAEHDKPQATAYLWADSLITRRNNQPRADQVAFICLPDAVVDQDHIEASVDIRLTRRTPEQLTGYANHVRAVINQIEAAKASGIFPPKPGPLCSWCSVCHACKPGQSWLREHGREMQPAIASMCQTAAQTA